jgi:kynureninase
MRVGTPPVLALSALDAALDVWDGVSMADVRAKSMALTERFVEGVESACAGTTGCAWCLPATRQRGSQVSFAHPTATPSCRP